MDVVDLKPSPIQEDEKCKSDKSTIGQASNESERNENTKMEEAEHVPIGDLRKESTMDLIIFVPDIENDVSGDMSAQAFPEPTESSAAALGNNQIFAEDNINSAIEDNTYSATEDNTYSATEDNTYSAIEDNTHSTIENNTHSTIEYNTYSATEDNTHSTIRCTHDDQLSRLRNTSKMLLNASREAFEKSLQAECFERSLQAEDFTEDSKRIPKRKSGSLSEMVLATLPLKKQKSEDSSDADDSPNEIELTGDMLQDSENSQYSSAISSISESLDEISEFHDGVTSYQQNPLADINSITPVQQTPPADILNWIGTFSGWERSKKLLALEQLLDSCESGQVRHVSAFIEPMLKRDFISLLPKELALVVLGFLKPRDLLRAAQTCQYWRIIAEDNLLWREKCEEAGLSHYLSSASQETLRRRNNMNTSFVYSTWKAGFLKQYRTEMNLRQNPIKDPKVLKGHDDHVITCLEFCDNKIVSGSDDNTLKIWCVVTGKCLRTLVGHTGGVWTSQMDRHFIISGSTDRCLKVWDVDTGSCLHTLRGHTSTVRCMHLHGGKVVSGSRDATLRMWDVREGECLHVLTGHMAAVRCVQFDGRLVISGGYDYMVKVWDPEREECLHTLVGHTNRVYSLQFDGIRTVVSGSLDTYIRVWDVVTGICRHTLMGHQSLTSGLELQGDVLVSGNADSTVKIWNILSGNCLQTLAGPHKHGSAVTSIQFNDKFVVTSSDDGTVKLWDVKTGEFIRDLVALESGGAGGVVWRIRMKGAKIVCAVGSRNGTEETKLLVLNFDTDDVE